MEQAELKKRGKEAEERMKRVEEKMKEEDSSAARVRNPVRKTISKSFFASNYVRLFV